MKLVRRLTALSLCAALTLSLSACRYSDVLEQIIYDLRRSQEIDLDAPFRPENNDLENEETSDDLKDLDVDDEAERRHDEVPELPEEGEETEEDGAPVRLNYQAGSEQEREAPVSEAAVTDHTAEASQETSRDADANGSGEGSGGTGSSGQSYDASNGAASAKQLVDAYGNQVDIPENVDRVAAVGNMAVMVMMLGGAERLAAANSGLTGDSAFTGVFPGLSDVNGLWSGEGGVPLSEGDFQALLELAPDVVLETSGSGAVSNSQAERLKEAGISYLVLPAPTSLDNVKHIMTSLGTVLGDKSAEGGANAPQIAASYVSWVSRAGEAVSQATSGHALTLNEKGNEYVNGTYTLYVDDWDDEAYYSLAGSGYVTMSGYGCAAVNNGVTASCQAISNYLKLANVINTAAEEGVVPERKYFTPLFSLAREMSVDGPGANGMFPSGTSGGGLLEPVSGVNLGTQAFPALLAADNRVKQKLEASELFALYPLINNGEGNMKAYGFTDEKGSQICTQIWGEYEVVVNPCGLCSWTQGSAESILESVWAAWRFFGAISEEEMRSYISDFYSQFYGCTLSNSELDRILEGK